MSEPSTTYPWETTRKRLYGWKAIGARINMSKSSAHRYSSVDDWVFPLPYYETPNGPMAYEDELTFWFARYQIPQGHEGALRRKAGRRGKRGTARASKAKTKAIAA